MKNKTRLIPYVLFVLIVLSLGFVAGKYYTQKTPTGAVAGQSAEDGKGGKALGLPDGEAEFKEENLEQATADEPVQEDGTPASRIIKEYAPGDVEVLRNRALEIVKESDCYKQEYELELSNGEEKYRSFYSTAKTINLVYDFNEQFHGWIVFKLVRINRQVKVDSLKVNIDVSEDKASCPESGLYYSDAEKQ